MEASDWLIENFDHSIIHKVVFGANTQNKRSKSLFLKGHNIVPKIESEIVYVFVWGHLWLWKNVRDQQKVASGYVQYNQFLKRFFTFLPDFRTLPSHTDSLLTKYTGISI